MRICDFSSIPNSNENVIKKRTHLQMKSVDLEIVFSVLVCVWFSLCIKFRLPPFIENPSSLLIGYRSYTVVDRTK